MGRLINQKSKTKIIRAFRTPSAPVVMSLMALILIIGAPALVSTIDDKASASFESQIDGLVELDEFKIYVDSSADVALKTVSSIKDNGSYTVALDTPATASTVRYYTFDHFSKSAMADVTKIVLTFDTDKIEEIRFIFGGTWNRFENVADADGNPTTTWTYEISSIDKARILSDVGYIGIRVLFTVGDAPAALTMDYETFGASSIAYGEIIVGATGAFLLICALFATPFFGLNGGYTGPKPKRRGA